MTASQSKPADVQAEHNDNDACKKENILNKSITSVKSSLRGHIIGARVISLLMVFINGHGMRRMWERRFCEIRTMLWPWFMHT